MRTLSVVDPTTAATLGGIAGLALGGVAMVAVRLSDRSTAAEMPPPDPPLPPGVGEVIAVLRSSGILVDSSDRVVNNSPAAVAQGLVRGQELVHPELLHLARAVRRDGVIREAELTLQKGIGDGRDFLANVSHELKTPVGGISLLAEAVLDAHDDPEAVARFAKRISVESDRLTRLVKEIVELSRLQGADVIKDPTLIDVGACARDAADRSRLIAEEHRIELVTAIDEGCEVWGDAELVTTAISNLVGNAIAYSDTGTRVGVMVRRGRAGVIDVSVTDQGLGIPPDEQQRIFERFYRVDTARSRATGGTGLGLAIVKHVADNHGGNVSVWSEPGRGSTFTIELPAANASAAIAPSRPTTYAALPPDPAAAAAPPAEPAEPAEPPAAPAAPDPPGAHRRAGPTPSVNA
jgi:two-component system sensor histidine kinase SenX3